MHDINERATAAPGATIRLAGISKFFSGVAALSDVDVEFHPGEVHAILGENGAGKSTLMNVIVGSLQPEQGSIEFCGSPVPAMSPELAASLGISICYQHPTILDDLSVLENLLVALPADFFAGRVVRDAAQQILAEVGLRLPLKTRGESLTFAQKQLLEIAKALAVKPKLLILDEPTASLDQEATDMLFSRVRAALRDGTSVIYITHRIAELREIAHRVTVLRDGRVRGGALVAEVSNQALLDMIVGRTLGSAFPPKHRGGEDDVLFSVKALTGAKYHDVSLEVARGQIVGVAGVAGNGQAELMRGLAGLEGARGEVRLAGRQLAHGQLQRLAAFMPSDRHAEGLAGSLSIRENAALGALDQFGAFGLVNAKRELQRIDEAFTALAVKAPSMEAPVLALSGGNQQKVVMARALLSKPQVIVADEPTQGVDVGARAEIYRILRENSNAGMAVIVNSSDAAELEGLCDKVLVMSRGRVVQTLTGDEVVEARIVAAAVEAETHVHGGAPARAQGPKTGWRHVLQTDNAPAVPLAVTVVLLALLGYSQNAHYLSSFNVSNILQLATTLGFIAMGQTVALLLGGIDLSVGPLAGFLVVVASFFINAGDPVPVILLGFVLLFGGALAVGTINGLLIRFANFTPIAATLAMYIGLQGASFLLRDGPGGYINPAMVNVISYQLGPIPLGFLVMCVVGLGAEWALRKWRPGLELRAVGSNEPSTRRIGLKINRIYVAGYIGSALFTALGAVTLMAQIGVGDPQQGVNYTLSSITAVVLGGTSLKGGRGTFIGTLLGALLLTEALNTVSFLGLAQTWQYVFQGALILFAAVIYSSVRGRATRT